MPKYGRGLNRELVAAVNCGLVSEPFDISSLERFVKQKGWSVPKTYLNVALSNATSVTHSLTYGKYFRCISEGKYELLPFCRGSGWK